MSTVEEPHGTRRDFLYIATGAVGTVGVAAVAWPFIDQMNPSASVLALSTAEFDLAPIEVGQSITVKWRGNPVFIRHRTEKEIAESKATPMSDLVDPVSRNVNAPEGSDASDINRVVDGKENMLIMMAICTHLGCVPVGEAGGFDGWFCPCHGSHYDTSGRIRSGPAPRNLDVPPYKYITDTKILVG